MSEGVTLAIEISNPSAAIDGHGPGVAIARDGRIIAEATVGGARASDGLMPAIAGLCERAGVVPSELGRVAVSIGPGGLTGLRVSVATAAMVCEATGARCVGVPTACVAAVGEQAGAGIVLASKGDRCWVSVVGEQGVETLGELDAQGFAGVVGGFSTVVCDAFLPEAWREAVERAGLAMVPVRLSAARLLEAQVGAAACDPGRLGVLYPREPEAVRVWRERRG